MICYLVRHGKDDDTVRGGWNEQPLTDEGKAQAGELASFVQRSDLGIKYIYSSDLLRVIQTAQRVADKLHLPIIPMPEFREVNNGDLAGMKNDLASKMYPGLYSRVRLICASSSTSRCTQSSHPCWIYSGKTEASS